MREEAAGDEQPSLASSGRGRQQLQFRIDYPQAGGHRILSEVSHRIHPTCQYHTQHVQERRGIHARVVTYCNSANGDK